MNAVAVLAVCNVVLLVLLIVAVVAAAQFIGFKHLAAQRLCVTLKHNEGAFIGLLTERSRKRWTFEDVSLVTTRPNIPPEPAAPGRVHVPISNILYYQELANAVE